jgi:VIT1/CCC1 family predicted Fe2+/Mn2+ transporter
MGVAAGGRSRVDVLLAGVAGLIAGAMSMAAGEYVSVQSQADSRRRIATSAASCASTGAELDEPASIYVDRGLTSRRPAGR